MKFHKKTASKIRNLINIVRVQNENPIITLNFLGHIFMIIIEDKLILQLKSYFL